MSDFEMLLAIAGIIVAVLGSIVVPTAIRVGSWMREVTAHLADIRIHQGRHDERLDDHERRLESGGL